MKKKTKQRLKSEFEEKFNRMFADVIPKTKIGKTNFELWKEEREAILSNLTDEQRTVIERKITLEVLKIFKKNKGKFFKYKHFNAIEEINEYFKIITVQGDRNIGKTFSSKEELRAENKKGNTWIILRNEQGEIKELIKSEKGDFLDPNGLKYDSKINPNILDDDGRIVGYYRDVNTIGKYKSIEFPDVELIVWDEFNSRVRIKDKFAKFVEFITTVQRHRPNLRVILQSNYVDQNDELLQKLGVGMKGLAKKEFIKFDWISGTILIFIPKGIYKSVPNKKTNLGYRLSLRDSETWQSQFGGGYKSEEPINIINIASIHTLKPLWNIKYRKSIKVNYGAYNMTMYTAYSKDYNEGRPFNFLTSTKEENDKPIVTFDYLNSVKYPNSIKLKADNLEMLLDAWNKGDILTDNMDTHNSITELLALASKQLEKNDNLTYDIEEM